MDKRERRRRAIIRRRIFVSCVCVVLAVAITAIGFAINAVIKSFNESRGESGSSDVSSISSEDKPTVDPHGVAASATVVNTGDIILHSTVLDGAKTADGSYDFSAFFREADDYFKNSDLAVANLEVTLGGTESGAFSGYPVFNAPDTLLDAVKNSGISVLLTANNHCYDTGFFGLKRTVQQIKAKGLQFIGTKELQTDPVYIVKNVNGVKIGMVSYTYETSRDANGTKYINANPVKSEATSFINSFSYDYIDSFYAEAQSVIADMKNNGADAVVFYMHWGNEYQTAPNTWQKTIAQKLCNMGVDVIVGGHPHVIQPIEMLYSEDSQNTTVCIYSLGNAISNQRIELMDSCPSGHTEDGMLFYYTFEKYNDGTAALTAVDIIPTWVDKYRGGSGYQYTMYPLNSAQDGANVYGLTGSAAQKSSASFERTKALVGSGLTACQTALGNEIRFKD